MLVFEANTGVDIQVPPAEESMEGHFLSTFGQLPGAGLALEVPLTSILIRLVFLPPLILYWTYLRLSFQYGRPDNSSRPGGPMASAIFISDSSNSTFYLLADNTTAIELIRDIRNNCSTSNLDSAKSSTTSIPYNETNPLSPQPESAIQYYRASSVVLALQGYNNTAVFQEEGTPDVPLPASLDITLKNCLNYTIGAAVPLIGSVRIQHAIPSTSFLVLLSILLRFLIVNLQ
jgi:hypothetical protein